MSFETGDKVAVIYSFHNPSLTQCWLPKTLHRPLQSFVQRCDGGAEQANDFAGVALTIRFKC